MEKKLLNKYWVSPERDCVPDGAYKSSPSEPILQLFPVTKTLNRKHYNCNAMVMDVLQVRVSRGLIKRIDALIATGVYASRSDVLRDAVRRLVLDTLIGSVPNKEDSVTQVATLRKKLSKEK